MSDRAGLPPRPPDICPRNSAAQRHGVAARSTVVPTLPLDRPVWHALTGRQAMLAQGDEYALRFDPDYAPFAAVPDPADLTALVVLARHGPLWLVEKQQIIPPRGLKIARSAECLQMIAGTVSKGARDHIFCDLGKTDADEMLALARLTQPGPFSTKTYRFGHFIGIRENGKLLAMAGERMKPGAFTELSGVCSHPDHRGRGYAGFLMRVVASRILARGEIPFLHCYATNKGAIALYQSLGFTIHQSIVASILTPD